MPTVEFIVKAAKAKAGAQEFQQAMQSSVNAARNAQGQFIATQKETDKLGLSFQKVGKLAGGFMAALGGSAVAMAGVKIIADYELQLRTLQGVTKASAEDMARFDDVARKLALNSKFSAAQAAETLLTLARAGLDVNQSIAATPAVINLASAEMMDMNVAADMVIGTLAQFGLKAEEAGRVSDVLIASSNAANTSASELGEAMKYAGSFAAALGMSLEDAAAAAAVMSNNNIRGSMAGTNLRGVLAALIAPTTEAKIALKEMGLEAKDVDVTTMSLVEALGKLKGMNAKQAESIFGRLNVAGALVLAGQTEEMKKIADVNRNAKGSAEELANTINGALIPRFGQLWSLIKEVALRLGDAGLKGAMHKVLDVAQDVMRVILGLKEGFTSAEGTARALVRTIEGLTAAFLTFFLVTSSGAGMAKLIALFTSLQKVVAATWALLAANPWAAVLAVVVGGIVMLRNETVTLGDTTATVGEFIVAIFQTLRDRALDAWNNLKEMFNEMVAGVGLFMRLAWDQLRDAWNKISPAIQAGFSGMWKSLTENAKTAINIIIALMLTMWDQIKAVADRARDLYDGLKMLASDDAVTKLMGYNKITKALSGDFLTKASMDFANRMKTDYVGNVTSAIKESGGLIWEGFKNTPFLGFLPTPAALIGEAQSFWNDVKSRVAYNRIGVGESSSGGGPAGAPAGAQYMDAPEDPTKSVDRKRFEQLFKDLETERELIGKTNREREIMVRYKQAEQLADELGVEDRERRLKQYRRQLELLEDTKQLRQIAEGVGDAFGNMFKSMISGAKDAREAMLNLAQAIMDTVLQTAVAQPIAQAVMSGIMRFGGSFMGGMGGAPTNADPNFIGPPAPRAYGGVFGSTGVEPFASGGVVDSPTAFGFGGRRVGVMGEAGPEAIIPLARGSDGKLGVRGGGGSITKTQVINVNIHTRSPDEFRRMPKSEFRKLLGNME